jgi:hypothetical protein
MNLENYSVNVCAEFYWIKIGKMNDFEERDEKTSGSIKASHFLTI